MLQMTMLQIPGDSSARLRRPRRASVALAALGLSVAPLVGACGDGPQPSSPSDVATVADDPASDVVCEGDGTVDGGVACAFRELTDHIDGLEADREIKKGHSRALGNKLRSAEKQASKGNLDAAFAMLGAFDEQVSAFERSGHVSSEVADGLREGSAFIRSLLEEDDPATPEPLSDVIVFASNRSGDLDLYAMGTDGSDPTPIAPEAGSADIAPVVSPDGSHILFRSNRGGVDDLFTMNADGSDIQNLTDDPAGTESPGSWNPDGTRVVFGSDRDGGNPDIYIVDTDGTGLTRVTDAAATNDDPAWSPDGTRIAFMSDRSGDATGDVWLMNADGTGQIRLTTTDGVDDGPAWFPDGTRLAFRSDRGGSADIWAMNADGSGLVRITDNPATDLEPRVSPDGTRIVFRTNRDGQYEIYTADADGSGSPARLTNDEAQDFSPDWSPAGDGP